MTRTRRAGVTALFGYGQFILAVVSGIAIVPFVLSRVHTEQYGVWLAFGEVLAYTTMVDLGVVGVVPWLIAENDGRRDRETMRRILVCALLFSSIAAAVFLVLSVGVLRLAPSLAHLSPELAREAWGPLLLMVLLLALTMPLRSFSAVLVGIQDATFSGVLGLGQLALGVGLTVAMLLAGQGLYALAAASTVPGLLVSVASWLRIRRIAPDLLVGWSLPGIALFRSVAAQGMGSWTAGLGWRLVAASDSIVILSLMGPAAAVVFAMTAKMGMIGMQMSWQLPDAALVGLAQLNGEGRRERVGEITLSLIRMLLVSSGGVACAVVALNPAFVSLWLGPSRFGGAVLNALVAAVILSHSVAHGLFTTSATLGARVQAGWAALLQGGVNLAAALLMGPVLGLSGIALAAVISTALVAGPAGIWMVRRTTGLGYRELWRRALAPWAMRMAGLLLLGGGVSYLGSVTTLWVPLGLSPLLGLLYLRVMRPLYADLPLPGGVRTLLTRLRLLPGEPGGEVAGAAPGLRARPMVEQTL